MKDTVEQVQDILKLWDDGILTRGEFDAKLRSIYLKPIFDSLAHGEQYMTYGSCCCSSHKPDKSYRCEVKIQPHGFTITPCNYRSFTPSQAESDAAVVFMKQHDIEKHGANEDKPRYAGAIGGAYTWEFKPTSLGTAVTVKCSCGEESNVTRYEDW